MIVELRDNETSPATLKTNVVFTTTMSDTSLEKLQPLLERQPVPSEVMKNVLSGTSALGVGIVVERAFSFLANILAARLGGASTFGAYSLAISTANSVSTYAAGGIGSTAIRFSGENARGTSSYPTLAKALALIAGVSCLLAGLTLWLGAAPLARLLAKPAMIPVLRWAALSAVGILLLECARGFFVGQRRLKAVVLLSATVGVGMVVVMPLASRFGAVPMIVGQSLVAVGAVAMCLALYKPLELLPPEPIVRPAPFRPLLKRVWSYGAMQLAGLVGLNAAGWWLTSLIAKGDGTMVQMGFFAVAHQFRNVVALAPSLLVEGSFAEMARENGEAENMPDQVMALCTYVSLLICMAVAGAGIVAAPWMLTLIYGKTYAAAAAVTTVALATSLAHMGTQAAWHRLSVIDIKLAGATNTTWAIFVAGASTLFLLHSSTAARGAAIYLAAHLLQAVLLVWALKRKGNMPAGLAPAMAFSMAVMVALVGVSVGRDYFPQQVAWLTAACAAVWLGGVAMLLYLGKQRGWLPSRQMVAKIASRFKRRR